MREVAELLDRDDTTGEMERFGLDIGGEVMWFYGEGNYRSWVLGGVEGKGRGSINYRFALMPRFGYASTVIYWDSSWRGTIFSISDCSSFSSDSHP